MAVTQPSVTDTARCDTAGPWQRPGRVCPVPGALRQSWFAMAPLTRSVCSLLLLALLLAAVPCPAQAGKPFGYPCSSPRRGLLDCRHAGLATVPPATSARPLDIL